VSALPRRPENAAVESLTTELDSQPVMLITERLRAERLIRITKTEPCRICL